MRTPVLGCVLLSLACSPLTPLRPDAGDAGLTDGGSGGSGGGATGGGSAGGATGGGLGGAVRVEVMLDGRSRLGARSARGFRPWRGGIAVLGTYLYWVESGTAPGLYRMPLSGCGAPPCPELVATLTRPSAFAATNDAVLVADLTALRRYLLAGGSEPVASATSEFVTLATDGQAAFWTTESAPIQKTPFGGQTSTIINSNGTPFAMTVAGDRVHWTGVDISGLQVVMQSIRTNGTGAREERRYGNGFQTNRGDARYLYFARDAPPSIVLRQTVSNGLLETVSNNAQGVADFAIDDTFAWWVEPGTQGLANGRVRRVAHDMTQDQPVAESVAWPVGIAVSGGVAYVLSAGTPAASWSDGKILRVTPQ